MSSVSQLSIVAMYSLQRYGDGANCMERTEDEYSLEGCKSFLATTVCSEKAHGDSTTRAPTVKPGKPT